MKKIKKTQGMGTGNALRILPGLLAAVLMALLLLCQVAVAQQGKHKEEMKKLEWPMRKVTIEKKSLIEVITTVGDSYAVSHYETMIIGVDGKQVSIRRMPVPCDAEVYFERKNGVRKARRIQITQVWPNATWQRTATRQPE